MKSFDVKQVEKFRDVFPELTTIEQLETAMLFSLGLSKKRLQRRVRLLTSRLKRCWMR
ncbi:hypothetical protein SODG_004989 [Sodalis praecaptivus]